jgi:hypothetical protein
MTSNSLGQLLLCVSQQFRHRCHWGVVIGIALLGVFLSASAQAKTFIVNNNSDAADAKPGDGFCVTATGVCMLRAAIEEANALGGANEIMLPPNTYRLDITSDLAITSNLTGRRRIEHYRRREQRHAPGERGLKD